jgi:hypothetical protein
MLYDEEQWLLHDDSISRYVTFAFRYGVTHSDLYKGIAARARARA